MTVDPKLLEDLRAVFLEEVAVQRKALAGLLVTLERETTDPAELRAATSEAFRIAHALKGAARAVGDEVLVALTHGVEDALVAVQSGGVVPRAVAVVAVARLLDGLPGEQPAAPRPDPSNEAEVLVTVSSAELRRMRDAARELRTLLSRMEPGGGGRTVLRARDRAIASARRLSRGLQRLYAQPVDEIAHHLERNALEVAKMKGKRVRFSVEGGTVRLDRGVLHHVIEALMHLVTNAVDHGIEPPGVRKEAGKPAYGQVSLRVRLDRTQVAFIVEDDGAGLDREALGALAPGEDQPAFVPGVSTSTNASTVSGRGMGLDFVRRCVDELGGDVNLESKPGGGTTVTLSVPMSEDGPASRLGSGAELARAVARRVLVVDDSNTTRLLVRLVLEAAGFVVDVAPDGETAWARLHEHGYAAVVSDLEMPGQGGFAFLERCRSEDAFTGLPILVLTGRDDADARERCERIGASAFIKKGTLEADTLLVALQRAIDRTGSTS